MTEHTPGPWVFEELQLSRPDGDGYIVTEGDRVEVVHHGGGESLGLSRDVVLANAHLIAAAPDLLEALEAFLIGDVPLKTLARKFDTGEMKRIKHGRRIVAKAKGQTP